MSLSTLPLSRLQEGEQGEVISLSLSGEIRRRLQDLGIIEGTPIRCLHRSIFSDPCAYLIRGSVIALRNCDTQKIQIQPSRNGGDEDGTL